MKIISEGSDRSRDDRHTILAVGDDPANLGLLSDYFNRFGHRMIVARDGESALEEARNNRPDLILLDTMISGVNGFETCRRLKADKVLWDIPVILITALTGIEDKMNGFRSGAVDYITKPFQFEEVLDRVRTHLALHMRQRQLQVQNVQLQQEIAERQLVEEAVCRLNVSLEQQVNHHTTELRTANIQLVQEIEKRKRGEAALRESEEKYRSILENIQEGYFEVDLAGSCTFFNKALCTMIDIPKSEMLGMNYKAFMEEEVAKIVCQGCNTVFTTGKPFEAIDVQVIRKNGTKRVVNSSVCLIKDKEGHRIGFRGVVRDITDRNRVEEKLKESEERYRVAIEGSNDGIAMVKNDQHIFCNQKFLKIFGYDRQEEILGQPMSKVVHPDDLNRVTEFNRLRQLGDPAPSRYEFKGVCKDGGRVFIEVSATKTSYRGEPVSLVFLRDVTERKKLESMLQQAQKMEAIGTLAGGIAHDFNNILAIIMGCTELSLITTPEDSLIHDHLSQVLEAGSRATDLVQQILTFSRKKVLERIPLQLSPVVKEILKMMRASLPSTIQIDQHIEPDTGLVLADPTQIHQLLMNLCTNAAHAMGENGGSLTITLSNADIFLKNQDILPEIAPGQYLLLTVRDTGLGMDRALLDRIFEPYFTTKESGEGTGLGLAVAHGIVKSYGGTILVQSEPGKGTLFQIFLPRIDRPIEVKGSEPPFESVPMGRETILLVDDEQAVLKIGQKMLEHLGYEVISSSTSLEALRLFRDQPDRFDLVVTDMTMPEMTGDRLAQEIMRIRPGFPVILCTGFTERITKDEAQTLGIRELLAKPLAIHTLAKTIREILDQKLTIEDRGSNGRYSDH
jgi:PAS domain S-box-containing protein